MALVATAAVAAVAAAAAVGVVRLRPDFTVFWRAGKPARFFSLQDAKETPFLLSASADPEKEVVGMSIVLTETGSRKYTVCGRAIKGIRG